MVFHPVSRSVRRLAGGLVLLAFFAAVTAPAQAAPRDASPVNAPTFQLIDWIHGLWTWLGLGTEPEAAPAPEDPDGTTAIFAKEGCGSDPYGSSCSDSEDISIASPTPLSLTWPSEK